LGKKVLYIKKKFPYSKDMFSHYTRMKGGHNDMMTMQVILSAFTDRLMPTEYCNASWKNEL